MPETERQFSWHTQEATAILEALGSTIESGLSTSEAAARLVVSGPNEFESDRPPTILKLVANQLADFMIGILILAALISGFLGDIVDTIAILIIVLLNAAVGVFQEYRAERAVAALREMSAPLARVIRDGSEQEIPTRDLVPGDIILLAAGDVVPADIRLLNVIDLGVDESAMTGESVPVSKDDHIGRTDGATIPEQHNMVWKSTMITRGRATGVAVAAPDENDAIQSPNRARSRGNLRHDLCYRANAGAARFADVDDCTQSCGRCSSGSTSGCNNCRTLTRRTTTRRSQSAGQAPASRGVSRVGKLYLRRQDGHVDRKPHATRRNSCRWRTLRRPVLRAI
jgi:hypothetical protein